MKLNLRIFVNAALTFAIIGFMTYLFIIIAGFFGCCAGITDFLFHKIVLILVVAGAVTFGICLYNNCYSHLRKP
ncbi:MAG: hypothetical protein P8100_09780 [bacterium]|jgi:hypothetical protein